MTVITLPCIPGLVWTVAESFSVREHGQLLHPSDAAEFLLELLACAPSALLPETQVVLTLRDGTWSVDGQVPYGELFDPRVSALLLQVLRGGAVTRSVM